MRVAAKHVAWKLRQRVNAIRTMREEGDREDAALMQEAAESLENLTQLLDRVTKVAEKYDTREVDDDEKEGA